MPSWLRGALAKSSRLIRHKCTKKFAPFCSYNAVDGATWFYLYKWRYAIWNISWLVQNRVWISGTSEISDSVVELCGHGVESTLAQTSLVFWKLNSWFFQMAMKADAYWFPGWDRGHIYRQEEMLIKSQVTRMHVLNICVSNGFIYLLYMTRFVCTLHNISSWFNLKLALQKLKWHVSREINYTTIKETLRVYLTVRTPSKN